MKSALVLGAALGLAVAMPAKAAEWVDVATSTTGTVFALDASSITIGKPVQIVWVRSTSKKAEADGTVRRTLRHRIDCDASTTTVLALLAHRADGTVTFSKTYATYEQQTDIIAPDTVMDEIKKLVCAYADAAPAAAK